MHILIDIGNSTIAIAMTDMDGNITNVWRFKTLKDETVSFFRYELKAGIRKYGIDTQDIETITISSVVPEINDYIAQAITDITGITPHFFNLNDALQRIDLDIELPAALGKDRLADAVGAEQKGITVAYGEYRTAFSHDRTQHLGVHAERCALWQCCHDRWYH